MERAPKFVVNYPPGFANAEINGQQVLLLRALYVGVVEALIVSGPEAGRRWQFLSKHLREVA